MQTFCSPSDPLFFMHHAFVDLLWEEWRTNCQITPWYDYPPAASPCGLFDPMLPFSPLLHIHGMIPFWTPVFYTYAPRPVTCSLDIDCDDRRLWCNAGHCTAKVKVGGSCAGYTVGSSSPCECGICNAALICQIVTLPQALDCLTI